MLVLKVLSHDSSNKFVQTVGSQMMQAGRTRENAHLKYNAAANAVVRRND